MFFTHECEVIERTSVNCGDSA